FLRFAGNFAEENGVNFSKGVATEKWWRGLKNRHPDFSLRSPEATSSGRHMAMTRLRLSRYFSELKTVLEENNLKDCGAKIWNMDETGLSLTHRPPKVIAKKGSKTVHSKVSTSRELITVIACGNADGSVIPPHVIIPGKTKRSLNSYDIQNAPAGTNISVSDSGWTKVGIGLLWFTETFLPNIGPERPQVLISDGHESHNHLEFVEKARDEQIILVELPSKTSHWTQPFDRSVFKSLKSNWNDNINEFTVQTGVAVGHGQFFRLFSKSWKMSMSASNITNGFVATGIIPYNPGIIPNEAYEPAELYDLTVESTSRDKSSLEEINTHVETQTTSAGHGSTIDPVLPIVPALEDNTELTELKDSMLVSLDIYSNEHIIDLPVAIDGTGAMSIINLDSNYHLQESTCSAETTFQSPVSRADSIVQPTEVSDVSSCPTVRECPPSTALSVIESALTDMLVRFQDAYEAGIDLNDSMFYSWKSYTSKAHQTRVKERPLEIKTENKMLTIPKQINKKSAKRKTGRSPYFVISSDAAYREMINEKEEKEKKKEEVEKRKRAREEQKREKELNKQIKIKKQIKGMNVPKTNEA
ncbi:MAG: hypothetical protein N0E48_03810, partial [Candidatus Thiodiazotropha endolucinida]|nr:hypothetical protein [Candidatus Thiodiazotropha taylori]MCW4342485.1 hypothetical protein [Candidatus Thiodiazotropha endolucinida]